MRVNDRGPFVKGRIIDLSYAAAKALGIVGPGTAPVHIEALGYQENGTPGQVVYRQPVSYDVGHFAVQVGAFTVAANADRLTAQLRDRYGAASIQQGYVGGRLFYRVRAGTTPRWRRPRQPGPVRAGGIRTVLWWRWSRGRGNVKMAVAILDSPFRPIGRAGCLGLRQGRRGSASVEGTDHPQRVFAGYMGVDHGGPEVVMAEEVLDGTDVIALLQEVGGKGVTQGMDRWQ